MELKPFELNAQGNKIDLSKPEDVALTIQRNEALDKVITKGIGIYELEFVAHIKVEFQCFKCGHIVTMTKMVEDYSQNVLWIDTEEVFHKCKKCQTKYSYCWESEKLKAKCKK